MSRLLVAIALIGIVLSPVVTAHPISVHLLNAGGNGMQSEFHDVAVLALFALFGASLMPLANVAHIVLRWSRSRTALRNLAAVAESHTCEAVEYRLIELPGVRFFTSGALRPTIYATVDARNRLSAEAFRAAILHERAHQRGHDVAWRMALAALETAFRPFPLMANAMSSLAVDCELAADRFALASGARSDHLFDAMVAASMSPTPVAATGLASAGTVERLQALVEPDASRSPSVPLPLLGFAAGLALLPIFTHALFWMGAVCP